MRFYFSGFEGSLSVQNCKAIFTIKILILLYIYIISPFITIYRLLILQFGLLILQFDRESYLSALRLV